MVVTYAGDVTRKLTKCGTKCSFRLNDSGNTEQVIEGSGSNRVDLLSIVEAMEPLLLSDCRKIGTVISHRWVSSQPIKPL